MTRRSPKKSGPALRVSVRPVAHDTLAARVYRGLRDMLMAGQVQPGQKLTLRQLAEALGTSPMPVREAVQRLAVEGALQALPNRAIRVPVMTKARFREVRMIRVALEGLAVGQAMPNLRSTDFDRLDRLNADFRHGMRSRDLDVRRVFRINKDLHFLVYESAAMPVLLAAIESFWLQIGPVLHLSLRMRAGAQRDNPAPDWHDQMIRALERRDAAGARRALEGDIMSAGDQILAESDLPD